MGLEQYSPIAANNTTLDGSIDISVTCPPANVALFTQQLAADARTWAESSAWFNLGFPITWVSGTSFSTSAPSWYSATPVNLTSKFVQYQRVKAVGSSTGTIYGTIQSSSYSSPTTTVTVTWDSGALVNETLTIYYAVFQPNQLPAVPYTPGPGSVNTSQIVDNAITTAKIVAGAVVTASITDGSITTAKIAANAVDSTKLATGLTLSGSTTINGSLTIGAYQATFGGGIVETYVAQNAATSSVINCASGTVFNLTLNQASTTLSFSNVPASGAYALTLVVSQDGTGGRTLTWPGSVKWANGTAPTLTATASKKDIITLITFDAGTSWYGCVAGKSY